MLPQLQPFQVLIEPAHTIELGATFVEEDPKGPATSTRVWVDDVNSDGKLDVLVGDMVTLVSAAEGLSLDELKEKLTTWQESLTAVLEEVRSDNADAANSADAQKRLREHYDKRTQFIREERTGFVWLYLGR